MKPRLLKVHENSVRLLLVSDWPLVRYEGIRDPSKLWKPKIQVSGLIQNSFELFYIFYISGKFDCQMYWRVRGVSHPSSSKKKLHPLKTGRVAFLLQCHFSGHKLKTSSEFSK